MAVYVDNARIPYGRMLMCHMWADSRDELFEMVDRIGIARRWFQRPAGSGIAGMDASWEHFDISVGKRDAAIRHGAIETDRYGPVEHCARLDIASGDLGRIARGERKLAMVAEVRKVPQ